MWSPKNSKIERCENDYKNGGWHKGRNSVKRGILSDSFTVLSTKLI